MTESRFREQVLKTGRSVVRLTCQDSPGRSREFPEHAIRIVTTDDIRAFYSAWIAFDHRRAEAFWGRLGDRGTVPLFPPQLEQRVIILSLYLPADGHGAGIVGKSTVMYCVRRQFMNGQTDFLHGFRTQTETGIPVNAKPVDTCLPVYGSVRCHNILNMGTSPLLPHQQIQTAGNGGDTLIQRGHKGGIRVRNRPSEHGPHDGQHVAGAVRDFPQKHPDAILVFLDLRHITGHAEDSLHDAVCIEERSQDVIPVTRRCPRYLTEATKPGVCTVTGFFQRLFSR